MFIGNGFGLMGQGRRGRRGRGRSASSSSSSSSLVARAFGFALASATADGDVAEGPTLSPVTATTPAEMAGLSEVVVVVVAELGDGGVAARAGEWVGRGRRSFDFSHGGVGVLVQGDFWHLVN